MAEPAAPPAPKWDPEAHYNVELKTPITIGLRQFRPGQNVQLRGDVMNANAEAIAKFNKVGG